MRKKTKMMNSVGVTLAILFYGTMLTLPVEVVAKPKVVAIKGMSYNVNSTMADNLRSLIGKKVYVTLDSGKSFTGLIKEVGNHLIHLENLDSKDYFDALLRIEDIGAIDGKFRKLQR
jgi:small nuclear ribonucleoprotein (snRNP)-like protein